MIMMVGLSQNPYVLNDLEFLGAMFSDNQRHYILINSLIHGTDLKESSQES